MDMVERQAIDAEWMSAKYPADLTRKQSAEVEEALRTTGEFNFDAAWDKRGAPYGTNVLLRVFPEAYRVAGMGSWYVPSVGTIVCTYTTITRIRKVAKNGRQPARPYK